MKHHPDEFDGFGFYKDILDGLVKFYYFDDVVKAHGPSPRDPEIPCDRECYHVMLTSIRRSIVYLDAPFISCFTDPFVYATNLAHSGFTGIMLKKTKWSHMVAETSIRYLRELYSLDNGYIYTDEQGLQTSYVKGNIL